MKSEYDICIIVAMVPGGVIGNNGTLPWRLPSDLARFKQFTTGHPVIMGRKTWESIPEKFRPLPGRTNIVVTRQKGYGAEGAIVVTSLEDARATAARAEGAGEIFIIGGEEIYRQFLPLARRVYTTEVCAPVAGDTLFPHMHPYEWKCSFQSLTRKWSPEDQYSTRLTVLERVSGLAHD